MCFVTHLNLTLRLTAAPTAGKLTPVEAFAHRVAGPAPMLAVHMSSKSGELLVFVRGEPKRRHVATKV